MPDGDGEREVFYRAPAMVPKTVVEQGQAFHTPESYGKYGLEFSSDCPKVSVVIPTYNRHELLYRVLYTLWKQQDPNYEVLVSNDDDPDCSRRTAKVIKEFKALGVPITEFKTGKYKRGRGWSVETYPYNVGIRHATGDIIMLNSGDVMSITGTIAQHRAHHIGNSELLVFSTVHALTSDTQKDIDSFDWKNKPTSILFRGSCHKMYTGIGKSYTMAYTQEDAHVPYHFQCSVRKSHLHEIRGFDEDFYGMMPCGDDDIAARLKKKGLNFVWDPYILAVHQFHGSPDNLSKGNTANVNPVHSGYSLYNSRVSGDIVRNAGGWGEYPRKFLERT